MNGIQHVHTAYYIFMNDKHSVFLNITSNRFLKVKHVQSIATKEIQVDMKSFKVIDKKNIVTLLPRDI